VIDREIDRRVNRRGYKVREERCDVYRGKPRGQKRERVAVNKTGLEVEEEILTGG